MRPFRSTTCLSFCTSLAASPYRGSPSRKCCCSALSWRWSRAPDSFLSGPLITIFDWAFYLFGIVLLIMAGNLAKRSESEGPGADTVITRIARRLLRTSDNYDGDRMFTVEHGRRVMTPMLVVMIAVGAADLLFAFDSIPALFGLSQNVYLVFSATALSLLGLRQLYFLID